MERYRPRAIEEQTETAGDRARSSGNYFAGPKSNLRFIHSGSKLFDMALGGGWAEGRIGNIVGDRSTGKTLLCIEALANFAKKYSKGRLFYREAEAAFDDDYAEALGMPLDRVDFGEPMETVEDVFEDLTSILKADAKTPSLYILDSLDALSDRSEMDRDMDAGTYGAEKAKKLSQMFRRLVRQMSDSRMTVIIVSQVRSKIGVTFGRSTTRSGGRALDFYASQVVFLSQLGMTSRTIGGVKRPTGIEVKAKLDKNKVALPFREAQFEIKFGFGIDDFAACLAWLAETGFLSDVSGVSKAKINEFVRQTNKASDEEYWSVVREVQEAVERRWYEVETRFLPTRRKYDG